MSSEIERRVRILDYIREKTSDEKGRVNKSDVMRRLQEYSRLNTTHKTIVDLINEGKIKPVKDKPRSQTHYLTIDEKNEFNKIYNSLLEFEKFIDAWGSFATAIRELGRLSDAGHLLVTHYEIPYESLIDSMIHFLLVKVSERHLNDQDSEILYRKIVRLFQKLSQRGLKDIKEKDLRENMNWRLNKFASESEKELKEDDKYFQKCASTYAKYHLDFGIRDDLLKIIKDFQTRFLS